MLLRFVKHPLVWIATILGVGCFPLPAQRGQFTAAEFEAMAQRMASDRVALIDYTEIDTSTTTIFDTRPYAEYEVSHLPGAIHVGYDDFDIDRVLSRAGVNDQVVVYCSVGYRSGKIGEKLQSAGYRNVYNLKGGLFGYANDGKALIGADEKPTDKVHGFNKKWSKWLRDHVETVY